VRKSGKCPMTHRPRSEIGQIREFPVWWGEQRHICHKLMIGANIAESIFVNRYSKRRCGEGPSPPLCGIEGSQSFRRITAIRTHSAFPVFAT
jgi:hypothetical protein